MILEAATLVNVRCHERLQVSFSPTITLISGPNASGKTTVLEAAVFALRGSSPKASAPAELIKRGEIFLRVELDLVSDGGARTVAAAAYDLDGERRVTADGAPLRDFSRWEELIPVCTFLPDDLQLIKGGPRRRRQYLDRLGRVAQPEYRGVLSRYEDGLRQRNALLKQGNLSDDHSPWEELLAQEGLELLRRRTMLMATLAPALAEAHGALVGSAAGLLSLTYRTNAAGLDSQAYRLALSSQRQLDRQRGFTGLGPHRDDLRFFLDGRDLRDYGSQGEQRSALLALLFAERAMLEAERGRIPLLLLDDVMSELDAERRRRLMDQLFRGGQAVLTTANLSYFTEEELERMLLVELPGCEAPARDG